MILHRVKAIPEDRQRALKHVSVTCRRFRPFAQESLLTEPCVRINRIHALISQYQRYPSLGARVITLEIRANDQEGCTCTYQNGVVTTAALQGFSSLIRLLPNVNTLLLGANQLKDITPLHFLVVPHGMIFCSHHGLTFPRAPNPLSSLPSHFFPDIASRITTLELPVIWAQEWCKDRYYTLFNVFWKLRGFTALKHLTMSFGALCSDLDIQRLSHDAVPFPESLQSLTISNVERLSLLWVMCCLRYYIIEKNRGCELSRIDIWVHGWSCRGAEGEYVYDNRLIRKLRNLILQYVSFVDIHYDARQSSYIRETLMARERNGRPMGEIEYFGVESRGWFEKFREEAHERDMEAWGQEAWLEGNEKYIFEAREIVEEREEELAHRAWEAVGRENALQWNPTY
jgi:hypothetical protein